MKDRLALLLTFAALLLLGAAALPMRPHIIWNRTASVPAGLYQVYDAGPAVRGGLVAYQPGMREARWLEARGFAGPGWPLIKRAAALEGDKVCREGDIVSINAAPVALALSSDSAGRAMPRWSGCRVLKKNDVLLLADHPRSVDGRYFGVQDQRRIIGSARMLWSGRPGSKRALDTPVPSGNGRRTSSDGG